MASCQIMWKTVWETLLNSCGFGVDKKVEKVDSLDIRTFSSWKNGLFMHLFIECVYKNNVFCGKQLLGRISRVLAFSTIST